MTDENGHHFYRGLHLGWAWRENERGTFLDFISEHRMVGMRAERIYPDGTTESIETPASMHVVTGDPEQDTEIERKFLTATILSTRTFETEDSLGGLSLR